MVDVCHTPSERRNSIRVLLLILCGWMWMEGIERGLSQNAGSSRMRNGGYGRQMWMLRGYNHPAQQDTAWLSDSQRRPETPQHNRAFWSNPRLTFRLIKDAFCLHSASSEASCVHNRVRSEQTHKAEIPLNAHNKACGIKNEGTKLVAFCPAHCALSFPIFMCEWNYCPPWATPGSLWLGDCFQSVLAEEKI